MDTRVGEGAAGPGVAEDLPSLVCCGCPGLGWLWGQGWPQNGPKWVQPLALGGGPGARPAQLSPTCTSGFWLGALTRGGEGLHSSSGKALASGHGLLLGHAGSPWRRCPLCSGPGAHPLGSLESVPDKSRGSISRQDLAAASEGLSTHLLTLLLTLLNVDAWATSLSSVTQPLGTKAP